MSIHENSGKCQKCQDIMNRYPGFNMLIRSWFEDCQEKFPEFHCADAGRGFSEQMAYLNRGASKASYGESAHNYNTGIDTFWLIDGKYCLDIELYDQRIKPSLPEWLAWGHDWTTFRETPHFEIKNWKDLKQMGVIRLVEPMPD